MSGVRRMGEVPILTCAMLAISLGATAQPRGELFVSDSKRFGPSKMDIVVREIERRGRSSVIALEIKQIGSSVGSSMFIVCSLRDLARIRGTRHIAKVEQFPADKQMLIGFLADEKEPAERSDPAFATVKVKDRTSVVELEQFSPICDMMK